MGKIIFQKDANGNVVYPVTLGDAVAVNGSTLTAKISKLDGIDTGAQKNVQSDWNATSGDAFIKNKPTIPSAVTEDTVAGWGFTKNTDTYSKPSGGIPSSDLASAVQTSLGKADSALQPNTAITGATKCKITYDANGLVTGGGNLAAGDIPSLAASKITSGTFADERIASAATWNGKQDALSFTGTPSSTNKVVTKDTLDAAVARASNYLGTVSATSGLSTSAKKGDFYRVSTAWTGVHVGDILIAEKDSPSQSVDNVNWTCLHNEINTDTHDTNTAGTGIAVSGTRGSQISINESYQTKIANGETAYGWGDHSQAGYLTKHQDISGKQNKITASGILKGNGSGTVSAATAGTDYLAPVTAVTAATADSASTKSTQVICNVTQTAAGQVSVTKSAYTLAKSVPSDAKFTDTTYESKAAAANGTDVSLVTTGEKATWNGKQNAITSSNKLAYSLISGTPSSLPASNTTNTYSGTGTVPVSGTAVKSAMSGLTAALTSNTTTYDDDKIAAIVDIAAVDTTIQ